MKSNKIISILCAVSMISAVISAVPAMAADQAYTYTVDYSEGFAYRIGQSTDSSNEDKSTNGICSGNWNNNNIAVYSGEKSAENIEREIQWGKTHNTSANQFKGFGVIYKFNISDYINDENVIATINLQQSTKRMVGVFVYTEMPSNDKANAEKIYNYCDLNQTTENLASDNRICSTESNGELDWEKLKASADTNGDVFLMLSDENLNNPTSLKLTTDGPDRPYITIKSDTAHPLTIEYDNYNEKLYQNESFDLNVSPKSLADKVEWSVTDSEGNPIDTDAYEITNGKFTYKTNNRVGGSSGILKITAKTDSETSNTLEVKCQRKLACQYLITDESGEVPDMNVKATVNGTVRYNESVTYGSNQHTQQNYSGHSTYEMIFTVPSGYTLEITSHETDDYYSVITEGNTVIVKNIADTDDEFFIKGTLTKNEPVSEVTLIKAMLEATEESGYTANQDGTISKDGVTYYGYTTSGVSGTGKATVSVTSDDDETQSKTIDTFIADDSGKVIFNIISNKALSAVSVDFN